jgi:UDP-N-acetylmuramoyl-tripeptide--D-alanyl-D-alanine ligase
MKTSRKPAVIILHGWGKEMSGRKYDAIKSSIENLGYTVYAPDFPGFGSEPLDKKVFEFSDYVQFVHDFFKKKKLSKAILIGHSFGGRVAIRFAARFPNLVYKLILTGASGIPRPLPTLKKKITYVATKVLRPLFMIPPLSLFFGFFRKLVYYSIGEMDYYKSGNLSETFKNVYNVSILPDLPLVKAPTLLVWGEKDTITPLADAEVMRELFIFFTIPFFIWITRNILFWVYLWQLKEYRFDRVRIHLFETYQGKKLLFSPSLILKLGLIIAFGYIIFDLDWLALYQFAIGVIFCYEAFHSMQEVITRRLRRPKFTIKSLFIVALALFLTVVFYSVPLVDKYVWLLLLDRSVPIVIAVVVLALSFPTELYRDFVIEKSVRKVRKHKKLFVIGVTGSYGKSSTKEYVAQILDKKFRVLRTKGTNNTPIGIAQTIETGLKNNTEIFVAEMGAYKKGEIKEMCEMVRPRVGILTAVSDQHLSLFGSLQNTMEAKYEIIESLPKNGIALFNGNNHNSRILFDRTKKNKILYQVVSGGKKGISGVYATGVHVKKTSVSFTAVLGKKRISLTAPLIGAHNVEDILPGIYLADHLGMTVKQIAQAVLSLAPLPKTMQKQVLQNKVDIIDDTFNASPHAVVAALNYMKIYKRKRILVMQPMIELGSNAKTEHYKIGRKIGAVCDYLFLTNANFFKQIVKGVESVSSTCEVHVGNSISISEFVKKKTKQGDIIVFEGKEAGLILDKVL